MEQVSDGKSLEKERKVSGASLGHSAFSKKQMSGIVGIDRPGGRCAVSTLGGTVFELIQMWDVQSRGRETEWIFHCL